VAPGIPPPPLPPRFKNAQTKNGTSKRLKPFFWNKLNNSKIPDTVWNDVSPAIEFDFGDLETTFTLANTTTAASRARAPSVKQNVTTMLDITRANNVGM
jgi:hypothetical protein